MYVLLSLKSPRNTRNDHLSTFSTQDMASFSETPCFDKGQEEHLRVPPVLSKNATKPASLSPEETEVGYKMPPAPTAVETLVNRATGSASEESSSDEEGDTKAEPPPLKQGLVGKQGVTNGAGKGFLLSPDKGGKAKEEEDDNEDEEEDEKEGDNNEEEEEKEKDDDQDDEDAADEGEKEANSHKKSARVPSHLPNQSPNRLSRRHPRLFWMKMRISG